MRAPTYFGATVRMRNDTVLLDPDWYTTPHLPPGAPLSAGVCSSVDVEAMPNPAASVTEPDVVTRVANTSRVALRRSVHATRYWPANTTAGLSSSPGAVE